MRAVMVFAGVAAVLAGLGKPAFAEPDSRATLEALAAKTAAIHDYHYRVETTAAGRIGTYIVECWYGGPDRIRVTTSYGGGLPLRDSVINGDEGYAISGYQLEVAKLDVSDRRRRGELLMSGGIGPIYLTGDALSLWPEATVTGTETVAGALCQIVDLGAADAALSGSLEQERDDFVAFIPRTGRSSGYRIWVDPETGMVRRWGHVYNGRVQSTSEVVETQQVDGFVFPATFTSPGTGREGGRRVTHAEVNQGIEEALAAVPLPANWLVNDQTLTLDEARKRLETDPDDASLHYTLGRLYERANLQSAEQEFRRAVELAPESATPLLALAGVMERGRRELDEAAATVETLRKAIALAGEDSWYVRFRLAGTLNNAGRVEEALAEYRALAAAGGPMPYWMAGELARGLARTGDFEGAYQAMAELPASTLAGMGPEVGPIVDWAAKSNHLDELRAKAEQAVAEEPESGPARLLLVNVLHALGRDDDARKALREIPVTADLAGSRGMAEVVSLARELGDEEFAAQARRAGVKQMIESGYTWGIGSLLGNDFTEATITELIAEAAPLWTEAADAQARSAILEAISNIPRSMRRGEGVMPQGEPDQMTPAECAIAGALAAGMAEEGYRGDDETAAARKRAAAYFERALTAWPNDAALWARVGKMRWSAEDWPGTAQAYQRAAAGDPGNPEYAARRAFALTRMNQCDQALEEGRQAIEPYAEEWAAQTFFATLEMDCGQLQPARDALVAVYDWPKGLESYQKDSVGRLLARCYERLEELDQAEAVLKRMVAEGNDSPAVRESQRLIEFYARHERRGDAYATAKTLYLEAGNYRDWAQHVALDGVRQAFQNDADAMTAAVEADLEAHPDDAGAVRFAAAVYEQAGRLKEALPLLVRATENNANDADVWIALADVAERAEDGALAAKALRRASELRPDDEGLRMRYARAAAEQGDVAAAKALADELRAKAGESAGAWREVAELYLTAESWDDARAAAERIAELTPEADEPAQMRAQVLMARAYAGKRDDHEARKRLIPILARAQDTNLLREAADALVNLYLLRDERAQAIATLTDLRTRSQARNLQYWIDQRLKEIAGEDVPPEG